MIIERVLTASVSINLVFTNEALTSMPNLDERVYDQHLSDFDITPEMVTKKLERLMQQLQQSNKKTTKLQPNKQTRNVQINSVKLKVRCSLYQDWCFNTYAYFVRGGTKCKTAPATPSLLVL